MAAATVMTPDALKLPIDLSAYSLSGDELEFFKSQTGIQNEDELRDHILDVQAEAYAVYPYSCIRRLAFTAFKVAKYPAYDAILKLGKGRQSAILLDLGCCFGGDARKAIYDGYPRENVIVSDLHAEFWDLGKKLYKNTPPEHLPECFLAGDIFDPSFLSPDVSPTPPSATLETPPPPLATLTSLTPLQHRISVIHTGSFFHLFDDVKQRRLAHLLGSLLSSLPGSMILGSHMGLPDTDEYKENGGWRSSGLRESRRFGHSPTSWTKLWVGNDGVFEPWDVIVWAETKEVARSYMNLESKDGHQRKGHLLVWSVTRV